MRVEYDGKEFDLSRRWETSGGSTNYDVHIITDFNESVHHSIKIAEEYSLNGVLLSPGCSSFDQFNNFEHRGNVFKDIVEEYYS